MAEVVKNPGYRVAFNGVHDGREQWSVECGCGWWDYRRISYKTAKQALREHREKRHSA